MTTRIRPTTPLPEGVYYLRHRFNKSGMPKCARVLATTGGYTLNGLPAPRRDIEAFYRFHHAAL